MPLPLRPAGLGVAAILAWAASAAAQPRGAAAPPYQVSLEGAEPTTGLGVSVPVRILDARDQTTVVDAQVSAARLVSPFGAVTPTPAPPTEAATPGVRLFQADLPTPGQWTLEFTVSSPGRPPAQATLGFDVAAPALRAVSGDPMGASVVATEPGGGAAGPAVTAPGPAVAGSTPAPPAPTPRSPGYSPANEAPH